ncbi:MAG: triose-phosphate isomerase [Deltaproteobacteria bacterium]|nr:triose-phosphate isomerase [Deltaproteobacteria bacterium]
MRRKLLVANWKMNFTMSETLSYVTVLLSELKAAGDADVAIAPPFTTLYSLGVLLAETNYQLAAQNLHWEESGAYTGEVAGSFLKDVGCRYVIVGHSERRQLFGETNVTVQKKVAAALRDGLVPILCVGEKLDEREANRTWEVIEGQLHTALQDLRAHDLEDFVIAYEPVWAIGTGKNATEAQAAEIHKMIREWLSRRVDGITAERTRILYGGSAKPENSRALLGQPHIDGLLVGGASLDAKKFAAMIRNLP